MGQSLIVPNADFSTNGISIGSELDLVTAAFEEAYYEFYRFTQAIISTSFTDYVSSTTRSCVKVIDASSLGLPDFVVSANDGYKFVPIQSDGSTGYFSFSWLTSSATFTDFDTYPYVALNLAYSDDSEIESDKSLWDFITISLA